MKGSALGGSLQERNSMILTDYLQCNKSIQWDYAVQCGVKNAVIRLPSLKEFDVTDVSHWGTIVERFENYGLHPIVLEPLPNELHDHIKAGDSERDACIEKVQKMLPNMAKYGIRTLCFNFMAYEGWTRTDKCISERGGALVTGFRMEEYQSKNDYMITEDELWDNYSYFIKAIVPEAERYEICLALHPDDPPVSRLGNISRIMISFENIKKALLIADSPNVGITMCQATYAMMGENLFEVIPALADRIFFVHFRNVVGEKNCFRETFHDNGMLDMAELLRLYRKCGVDVPIRVDHVPTMAGEKNDLPGYAALGRLFAIGYLKGLMDAIED